MICLFIITNLGRIISAILSAVVISISKFGSPNNIIFVLVSDMHVQSEVEFNSWERI